MSTRWTSKRRRSFSAHHAGELSQIEGACLAGLAPLAGQESGERQVLDVAKTGATGTRSVEVLVSMTDLSLVAEAWEPERSPSR
jgi:hypothetical protein